MLKLPSSHCQFLVLAVRFTPVPFPEEGKKKRDFRRAFYLLLEAEAGQAAARRWQWELMDGGEPQGKTLSTPDRSQWGFSILRHYFSATLDRWKSYSQACSAEPTVDNFVQAATGWLEVWLTRSVDNWLLTEVCQSRLEKCNDLLSRVGLAAAARSYHIKQELILERLYLGFRDYNF